MVANNNKRSTICFGERALNGSNGFWPIGLSGLVPSISSARSTACQLHDLSLVVACKVDDKAFQRTF